VPSTMCELRDHAVVAMLIGCGLRRAELLSPRLESIQRREEHWTIADLVGKAGHVRTVPIPTWVKAAMDAWTGAAKIMDGPVVHGINKAGRIWGDGMSAKVLWHVVRAPRLAPGSTGSARPAAHVRSSLPCRGQRTGSDPVPARPRFHPDDGALPRMQGEAPNCREWPIGNRARCSLTRIIVQGGGFDPPRATGADPSAARSYFFAGGCPVLQEGR